MGRVCYGLRCPGTGFEILQQQKITLLVSGNFDLCHLGALSHFIPIYGEVSEHPQILKLKFFCENYYPNYHFKDIQHKTDICCILFR